MWFFSRGKFIITPEKWNFAPGETIKGTLGLILKKPKKAKSISIALIGERKVRQMTSNGTRYSTEKIYDFKIPLDGEKEYGISQANYNFNIRIPADILNQVPKVDGTLGNIVKAAQMLSGRTATIKWFLESQLDIPHAIDMRTRVQINIA